LHLGPANPCVVLTFSVVSDGPFESFPFIVITSHVERFRTQER